MMDSLTKEWPRVVRLSLFLLVATVALAAILPRLLSIQVPTAAKRGSIRQLQWLLACGANVDAVAADGKTALHWAAEQGQTKTARFLLERGANGNVRDAEGKTPLQWAVWAGSLPIMRALLAAGAVVDTNRPTDASMLVEASRHHNLEILELLLRRGLDPNVQFGRHQQTPLHQAAWSGHYDMVEFLLERGADPGIVNGQEKTALDLAVVQGHIETLRLLLPVTRPDFSTDHLDSFLLSVAARRNRLQVLHSLMVAGADPNWKDDHGATALHQAAAGPHPIAIKLLLGQGADVNARNDQQETPLHIAVQQGSSEAVLLLLEENAEVNALNTAGETPLVAALRGSDVADGILEIVEILLAHGADVDQADRDGRTPLDWAGQLNDDVVSAISTSANSREDTANVSQLEEMERALNRLLYSRE